ncbi:MAG TPA: hypothetical protein VIV06_00660 [Candidatus Limnocylindrales bacterium]
MNPVHVAILHAAPGAGAGPLERLVAEARLEIADRHRARFMAAGASDAWVVAGPPDGRSFGGRLGTLLERLRTRTGSAFGVVVLGSGSVPLLRPADARRFVETASGGDGAVLANNRYSADIVAIGRANELPAIDLLFSDNALPRWLDERAGRIVRDLRDRPHLGFDVDSPLDLVLLGWGGAFAPEVVRRGRRVEGRLSALRDVASNPAAELVVAGRTGSRALALLERATACRVRALVEERGLRAGSGHARPARDQMQRRPRSLLGMVLDRHGPAAFGRVLAELGDAALVDTRVLLAHRHGADESAWPSAEDRFASDLLDPEAIGDPWLRELTASACRAPIPIVLGGHSLVGPGLDLALRQRTPGGASR